MTAFTVGSSGSLNAQEKRIAKKLLNDGKSNQDVQAFVNFGRPKSVNFARVSAVKSDKAQKAASEEELSEYTVCKNAFDAKTGLNPFIDERLTKSRDAMKLAVSLFNNPSISFRTETFTVLSIVAWTYAAIEYCARNQLPVERTDGKAISVADFLKLAGCPLSEGVKNNLGSVVKLRDLVEHRLLGSEDPGWISLFQANCINYEKFITTAFGEKVSLAKDMSFSLQFSGFSIAHTEQLAKSGLSSSIKSINAKIYQGLSASQKDDQEFQFSVVYTTVSASKSKAAFKFHSSDSPEGKQISEVLVKLKPSAESHPFLASEVVRKVAQNTGTRFSLNDHTEYWRKHEIRPGTTSAIPAKTDTDYCYYNPTYKRHSYNQKWIDLICTEIERDRI